MPELKCRCGQSVSLYLLEDKTWQARCLRNHCGKARKLPSDAVISWHEYQKGEKL
jgi:hypothetical protein